MDTQRKADDIRQRTRDGQDLTADDRQMLEYAEKGYLNEIGLEAFDELHRRVMAGAYTPVW